jgi:uncharacterized protein YbjQ (UPF0145 family)
MPGVYTTQFYDVNEWEPVDIITVSHNEAVSLFRDIGVQFGQLFGGKSYLLEKKMKDLRETMIKRAESLIKDKDHIMVGFDVETSQYQQIFILIATGTLLKRKNSQGGGAKTAHKRNTRRRK